MNQNYFSSHKIPPDDADKENHIINDFQNSSHRFVRAMRRGCGRQTLDSNTHAAAYMLHIVDNAAVLTRRNFATEI